MVPYPIFFYIWITVYNSPKKIDQFIGPVPRFHKLNSSGSFLIKIHGHLTFPKSLGVLRCLFRKPYWSYTTKYGIPPNALTAFFYKTRSNLFSLIAGFTLDNMESKKRGYSYTLIDTTRIYRIPNLSTFL